MVLLAEGMGFDSVYSPKRLYFGGPAIRVDLHHVFDSQTVQLFHYTDERFDRPLRRNSYWSGCLTDAPAIAGEATGIGNIECVWRVKWRFPIERAFDFLKIGHVRFSEAGAFREFNNRNEVDLADMTWHKMDAI